MCICVCMLEVNDPCYTYLRGLCGVCVHMCICVCMLEVNDPCYTYLRGLCGVCVHVCMCACMCVCMLEVHLYVSL